MARRDRGGDDENAELNLVPFMNMVVVIIPMLLLSVVFLKAGVINITSPKLSVGPPSEKKPEKKKKPLNLTVTIGDKGIRIAATGAVMGPEEGCPSPGPTLCMTDDSVDIDQKVKRARSKFEQGGKAASKEAHGIIQEASMAYDWMGLYNKLMEIKKQYPDETVVKVSADPDIPYAFIVRAMDVARYKLPEESYDTREDFWAAKPKTEVKGDKKVAKKLFSDPILAIAK